MATSRRARPPKAYAETDSDTDHESTPRPKRTGVKRRVSEFHADASFTIESSRIPLKTVNINDDAAERRMRRKSIKIDNQARRSLENLSQEQDPGSTPRTAKTRQIENVALPETINVPLDVMSSNFEEWMKMATDNKINATNSWNFALIDYFHDMSLLRNNADNSINFQRASCTLDGCVKIWTSRVDSVGTETGKLLSNLANEAQADDEAGSDNLEAQDPTQRKRGKAHRAEATLAKNVTQLKIKKLDLEFSVDPLFRKTCADFDEGGAHGLLMNHLSLGVGKDGGMRVVFDASDSIMPAANEGEDDKLEPEEAVDLSYLRKEFLQDLSVLGRKAICQSLAGFSFSKDTFVFEEPIFLPDDDQGIDNEDDNEVDAIPGDSIEEDKSLKPDPPENVPVEDFFTGEQAVYDDYVDGDMGMEFGGGVDEPGSVGVDTDQGTAIDPTVTQPLTALEPPRIPNERDLIMAMTDADGDGGMLDYFDQNFLKNWAGPEHWKLRKVVRKHEPDPTAPKPKREKKEAFKIDFLTEDQRDLKDITKALFAPPRKGVSINLPGTANLAPKVSRGKKKPVKPKKDEHLLPDDMHFSSRQLVSLFLKPKFTWRMRGQRGRLDPNKNVEIDENFWAQAAADQAAGRASFEGDETVNSGALPFSTQFFNDDYDDNPGFDDVFDGDGDALGVRQVDASEQDLLAATQGQTRRVKPEAVNYAKRAKRVDVKKLKENIWKNLDIVVEPTENQMQKENPQELTDPSESRVFSSVISGLEKSYPKEKLEEISTSFCFICLLHLANERGLRLESTKDETSDQDDVEDIVGSIRSLKIFRDPSATRSA